MNGFSDGPMNGPVSLVRVLRVRSVARVHMKSPPEVCHTSLQKEAAVASGAGMSQKSQMRVVVSAQRYEGGVWLRQHNCEGQPSAQPGIFLRSDLPGSFTTLGGRRRLEGNRRRLEGNRRRLEGGRRRLEGNRRRLEGDRRRLEGNRRRLKGNRRRLEAFLVCTVKEPMCIPYMWKKKRTPL